MKRITELLLCISCLITAACVREDMSNCPLPLNVSLTFSYTGDTYDPSMFDKTVDHIILMVFDENGSRVTNIEVNKKELEKSREVQLSLSPGNYRAVCWGNSDEHTETADCEFLSRGRLHHPGHRLGTEISTNSHLYYGVYGFSVPKNGLVEGDIPLRGAHINIEVYIRSDVSGKGNYEVKAHNLMPQYNLEMLPAQPFATTYCPQMGYDTEKKMDVCIFQTLRFDDANPVIMEVYQPSGDTFQFELQRYMVENEITVNNKNEATVPILLEYSDLGVVIKIPEWLSHNVTPET